MKPHLSACVVSCVLLLTGQAWGAAGATVKDVESSAKQGAFLQAFAQSRALLEASPSAGDLAALRSVFERFPQISHDGVAAIERAIDTARTEARLIRGQSDIVSFARCVRASVCAAELLSRMQRRFTSAASALILDADIPVTFESNLLANWMVSAGSSPTEDVERRIFRNSLANIAAKDPRDSPSVLMSDRLFRYLLREPGARDEAFVVVEKVCWQAREIDGPLREIFPGVAAKRRAELDRSDLLNRNAEPGLYQVIELDDRGVEFGPWVRRFRMAVQRNWVIPYEAMSKRGHVAVAADVYKNGRIADVMVTGPSEVGARRRHLLLQRLTASEMSERRYEVFDARSAIHSRPSTAPMVPPTAVAPLRVGPSGRSGTRARSSIMKCSPNAGTSSAWRSRESDTFTSSAL